MRINKILPITRSVLSIILGIVLIILHDIEASTTSMIFGALLLVYAAISLIEYLQLRTPISLGKLLLHITLGILMLAIVPRFMQTNAFGIIVGCMYLIRGVFGVYTGDIYRRAGLPHAWVKISVAIAKIAISIPLLIVQDISTIVWLFGIALIIDGVSYIVNHLLVKKTKDKMSHQPEVQYFIHDDTNNNQQ